jgi:hypothetical protein
MSTMSYLIPLVGTAGLENQSMLAMFYFTLRMFPSIFELFVFKFELY